MNIRNLYLALGLVVFALFFSCKKKDMPLTKETPIDLDTIAAHYYEEYLKLYPLEATMQGDERYNDQLPINIDKDFINGEIAFYTKVQEQLKRVDYESLSDDKKVVYDVLETTLKDKMERYIYKPEYIPFTQFEGLPLLFPVLGSGQGIQPFNTEKDYDNWLKRMSQFPIWIDAAINNFDEGIKNEVVLPKKLEIKMIRQLRAGKLPVFHLKKISFISLCRISLSLLTPKQSKNIPSSTNKR